jgi:hypothetical protein
MDINNNPRYAGKPLLRILECYVLYSIGELNTEDNQKLQKISPKLSKVYGVDGAWTEIVESVMDLPETFIDQVREIWERNRTLAAKNGEILNAQDFAEMFVDTNLSP